jgi:hypothetical protein
MGIRESTSVKTVETSSPPTTTRAEPAVHLRAGAREEHEREHAAHRGEHDMKIGRMRVRTALPGGDGGEGFELLDLALGLAVPRMKLSAWWTSRIALLTTTPIRMTNPSMVRTSSCWGAMVGSASETRARSRAREPADDRERDADHDHERVDEALEERAMSR